MSSVRSSRLSRSARYSVQNQRGASPSLAPLVFHGTSFSFLLSLAAVVLGSSQLTDKKSPSCTLFDIGVLFCSRSHPLYLTESRSPSCTLFDIGALFRSRSHLLYLTESRSPFCTLFDIGALFRSRSHHLYLTESRSPLLCHWQQSSLFLSRSARYSVQNRRGASPSLAPLVFHGTSFSFLLPPAAVALGSSQLTDKKSPS